MRGYPIPHAIKAFVSHCQLSKGNAPLWVRFQEGTLREFMCFALSKGAHTMESLEPWHLSDYLRWRQEVKEDKPATLTRRAMTIRAMSRWVEDEGRVKVSPLARSKMPKQTRFQRELPAFDIIRLVVQRIEYQDVREACELLLLTGLRRTELLALRWADMDLTAGVAFVRSTNLYTPKSRKARAVPLPARAVAIMQERKDRQGSHSSTYTGPFLRQGKAVPHKDTLSKEFRRVADAASFPGLRLHDLRHAFCTRALNDLKADILTVQACAGHGDIETTRGYCHANPDSALALKVLIDAAE